jgi:hypothetical protein
LPVRLICGKSWKRSPQAGRDFPRGVLVFVCLAFLFSPTIACLAEDSDTKLTPTEAETLFLDRLMRAESAGRRFAKNPASSALGPFQFLGTTFLDVVRRNFPGLASGKTDVEILALRTDFEVSRKVALVYTRENAAALSAKGKETTAVNLRLAFFCGPNGALRVLEAEPDEPVSNLLSQAAIAANPFLRNMTVSQLLARASREAEGLGTAAVATGVLPKSPGASSKIAVHCNLGLASCRHWLALAEKRVAVREARAVSRTPKAKEAGH